MTIFIDLVFIFIAASLLIGIGLAFLGGIIIQEAIQLKVFKFPDSLIFVAGIIITIQAISIGVLYYQ